VKPYVYTRLLTMGDSRRYEVQAPTIANAIRAVTERVFYVKSERGFVPPPVPRPGIFRSTLRRFKRHIVSAVATVPRYTKDQFLSTYSGRKAQLYRRAFDSLLVQEVSERDARCRAFGKKEKVDVTVKGDPPQRLIQPRDPRYNAVVGCYTKPIEHNVYRAIDSMFGAPVVAKGKNAIERACMLREAWDALDDPVAIFMDASRFDQHTSVQALQWEHSVYAAIFGGDPELRRLLSWQLTNRGTVRCSDGTIDYLVRGGRCSGDMNTALGNVLIMCALMQAFLGRFGKHARLVNDGDDCVVLVERRLYQVVKDTYHKWFLEYGYTMKLDGYTDEFEKIEFCKTQPVWTGTHWVMCRDPRLVLDKDIISTRRLCSKTEWARQCTSIGQCGLALAGNLPVFTSFYRMLDQRVKLKGGVPTTGMEYLARGMTEGGGSPSPDARFSFFVAFGITPDEQRALESFYSSLTLQFAKQAPESNLQEPHTELLRI